MSDAVESVAAEGDAENALKVAATEAVDAGETTPEDEELAASLSAEAAAARLGDLKDRGVEFFRDTDGGNADRFAARFGRRILAEVDGRGTRWFYTADETNLWSRDETGVAARMAEAVVADLYRRATELNPPGEVPEPDPWEATRERGRHLETLARRSDTVVGRRNMAALATDKYGLRVPGARHFDANTRLLAVGGGQVLVFDEGGSVVSRRRRLGDLCSAVVHADWRPEILESPPDLVKQFVETFLPEPGRVELLFKLLGHALTGGNPRRYFVIIRGGTTSGKTQLVAALQRVLGRYVGTSPATIFRASKDDRPRPDVIRLYRKRLAFLPEASKKSWELHASRIKQFTGGDQDPQRAMRSDVFIEERPLCMPVVYTNEMPKIVGMDDATKRRVIVPAMEHTLPKDREDPAIKEAFINDPEVAAWLLAALVRGWEASRVGGSGSASGSGVGGCMDDVEDAFSLATRAGVDELYHLGDFMEWAKANSRLTWVPEDERGYGVKSSYVTLEALHGCYVTWVKTFGGRYDRLEQLGLVEFNVELKTNHGFTQVNSAGRRWEGWRLADAGTNVGDWSELRASSGAIFN